MINNLEVDPAPIDVPIGVVSSSFFDCDLDRDHPLFLLFLRLRVRCSITLASAMYCISHLRCTSSNASSSEQTMNFVTHLQSLARDTCKPSHHITFDRVRSHKIRPETSRIGSTWCTRVRCVRVMVLPPGHTRVRGFAVRRSDGFARQHRAPESDHLL